MEPMVNPALIYLMGTVGEFKLPVLGMHWDQEGVSFACKMRDVLKEGADEGNNFRQFV